MGLIIDGEHDYSAAWQWARQYRDELKILCVRAIKKAAECCRKSPQQEDWMPAFIQWADGLGGWNEMFFNVPGGGVPPEINALLILMKKFQSPDQSQALTACELARHGYLEVRGCVLSGWKGGHYSLCIGHNAISELVGSLECSAKCIAREC